MVGKGKRGVVEREKDESKMRMKNKLIIKGRIR